MLVKGQKVDGKLKATLNSIQDLIDNQPNLKAGLEEVVNAEKKIFDAGSKQVMEVAKYLKANWKIVVPALAALGVGAHIMTSRKKTVVKAKKLAK